MRIDLAGWTREATRGSHREFLALFERAERLGFEGVWFNEFRVPDTPWPYPSPLLLAAALLARTERLRVGTSVLVLPLFHPLLLAEEIAERETTVVISSHNLRELEDVCDHVGILDHGRVLLERSLSDLQDNTVKLQVAYPGVTEPVLPAEMQILHRSHVGRVYTYIIRGSSQEIMRRMQITEPVLLESIPLTLEEIFIYELGGVDDAVRKNVL